MQENSHFKYHEHDELPDSMPNISNVASATETTGLMPTPPHNAQEMHSYQDMASMEIPKIAPGKNDDSELRRVKRVKKEDQSPDM